MPQYVQAIVAQTSGLLQFTGGGISHLVQATNGYLYCFYVDTNADLVFRRSSDGGLLWSTPTVILAGTVVSFAVWYDRWSGIAADLIHLAYTDGTDHDTKYRTINTGSSDTLSTETVIFAGASQGAGGCLSIARARGGNVYCKTMIDAGLEGGWFRLPTANVPDGAWDAALTIDEALASTDQIIVLPSWNDDDQDMMAFFWDASANEVSRKLYDDSGDAWGETSVATTMLDSAFSTAGPHFAAAVDLANSQNWLIAWSAIDGSLADLRCWKVTEAAITEMTPVVSNGVDDQGLAALGLDTVTGYLYAFYAGNSDGSETWPTAINLYHKVSKDGGVTWGPESMISAAVQVVRWLACSPRFTGAWTLASHKDLALDEIKVTLPQRVPRATFQIGF